MLGSTSQIIVQNRHGDLPASAMITYLHPSHSIVPVLPIYISQYCPSLTYIHLTNIVADVPNVPTSIREPKAHAHNIVPVLPTSTSQYCPGLTYIHTTILSWSYLHSSQNIVPYVPTSMPQYCPGLTYIHFTILSRTYLHPFHNIVPALPTSMPQYCPGLTYIHATILSRSYLHPFHNIVPALPTSISEYCPGHTYIHLTILSRPPIRALAVLIAHVVAVSYTASTITTFQGARHISYKKISILNDSWFLRILLSFKG